MTQIDPRSIFWFQLGHPFHWSLQWGFWHEYGSDPGVIVCWKNTLFFLLDFLLLITQDKYELSSTHIFILPILKTNSKTLIPQHILYTSQSLLPHPATYPHPCLILHLPNLGCHYWPHPDIILASPLLLFLPRIFSNRLVHVSLPGGRGDVLEVII